MTTYHKMKSCQKTLRKVRTNHQVL